MIEINNLTNFSVDKKSFSQVAKKVLSGENRRIENISLAFVDKTEIKKLNKKFRKKNKPTDVLAFGENPKSNPPAGGQNPKCNYLGEIVICPEVVAENAKKYGVTKKQEMTKVFVHGVLHLLGYDHEKLEEAEDMEFRQEKYLSIVI